MRDLTNMEREVVKILATTGGTNKEIADSLHISTSTVKVHLRSAMLKLDIYTRAGVVIYAWKEGMVGLVSEGSEG